MGLGRQYFLRCSWSLGDILVVDSIWFYPIMGLVFLVMIYWFS